ncbi:MAG: relaxase/mobilization nuclease domain-containing protein [Cyanobacteria bacterium P01_G01_bin.19]
MIGKVTTGSSFDCLFRYLLKDDKQARIIGGDRLLLEPDARELASQFNWIASTRPTTKKPVKHISIGFAPTDGEVDDSIKVAISEAVVNQLGYTNNQWIAIAHGRNDPGHDWQHHHDHIHIVINAIDFNGERVSDSFDKTRLEKILRELEAEHDLTNVISSQSGDRQRPKTNQLKRYQRESREYPDTAPEIPIMAKLEAAIDVASRDKPTMTSFIGRMQQLGIDVRLYIRDKGRKRISYRLGDFKVRGSKLHNGSFPKLLLERSIDFDEVRDIPAIKAAYQGKSVEIDSNQLLSWEQINLDYWLPQPLKALAKAYSTENIRQIPDPKQWNNLQKTLLTRYGIPEHISAGLNEANLLSANGKGELIWHKRSLLGSKNSHFWFEIKDRDERVEKMVVTSSPVEAVSAYLVDRLVNKEDRPCLYLSLDCSEQLIELDLTEFDTVVVNSRDKQFIPDRVSNLVIQENVSSWHQSWLIHWNKVEAILKSEANNKNTSLQKQTNHSSKQLEL